MKITIMGTGYVGLVTGACFASMGNEVLCVDSDAGRVAALQAGKIPFHEPGLRNMVAADSAAGRLQFTSDIEQGVAHGRVQFIAVGTPQSEDGSADLSQVTAVAQAIGAAMTDYRVIVNKSTVPVGTADQVRDIINAELARRGVVVPFSVISNPEFLKEGAAVQDFMRPDRVIIGASDERAIRIMRELYGTILRSHDRLMVMDERSAELTKYAANAMLATRISFMNELARYADSVGADIESVRQGMGSDSRIGYAFLYAGCGYGGSCFPKDIRALMKAGDQQGGVQFEILRAVESVNHSQKRILAARIRQRLNDKLKGKHIAVWGLSFKPETDDMREAPSCDLIRELLAAGAVVCAYDPVAMPAARQFLGDVPRLSYAASAMAACDGADVLAVVTEWKEFRGIDPAELGRRLKGRLVFDGRNVFQPQAMAEAGIEYYGIGRRAQPQEMQV